MKKKPKPKKGRPTYNVSAAQFVEAWSTSTSIDEVMTKTGLPRNAVYSRVNSYRKKQIKLRKMSRPTVRMDIEALNAIVQKNTTKKGS